MGLAQAGHALQQHVAPGDHRQKQVLHHVFLTNHFLGDLFSDLLILPGKPFYFLLCMHGQTPYAYSSVRAVK